MVLKLVLQVFMHNQRPAFLTPVAFLLQADEREFASGTDFKEEHNFFGLEGGERERGFV